MKNTRQKIVFEQSAQAIGAILTNAFIIIGRLGEKIGASEYHFHSRLDDNLSVLMGVGPTLTLKIYYAGISVFLAYELYPEEWQIERFAEGEWREVLSQCAADVFASNKS